MWTSFVGFMASGKTTAARVLAHGGRLPFVDLDETIESLAGATVPEIFRTGGVDRFRALEAEALAGLDPDALLVLATGGGCVETPAVRTILRERGVVIWLDAPWEVLRRRIEAAGSDRRPMVGHLGWDGMDRLHVRRQHLYARTAHFRLRSDRQDAASTARTALLRSLVWRDRRVREA